MHDETPRAAKRLASDGSWTFRDMLLGGVAAVAAMAVAIILLVVVLLLLSPGDVEGAVTPLTIAVFAAEAVLVVPAWWWGPRKYGGGWPRLGFRSFDWGRGLLWVIAGLVLTLAVNLAWEPIREMLGWAAQAEVLPLFGGGLWGLAWALLVGAIVAPVAEEVFFRGFLFAGLRDRLGLGWGIAISALIFGVVHLTPGVLVPIALMGAILAGLYELTGSLWPSILLHMSINALAMIGAYAAGG